MQQNQSTDLDSIVIDMSELDKKIAFLTSLKENDCKKIQIYFTIVEKDRSQRLDNIDQSHTPFNLQQEFKILVIDSIEELQRQKESLANIYLLASK